MTKFSTFTTLIRTVSLALPVTMMALFLPLDSGAQVQGQGVVDPVSPAENIPQVETPLPGAGNVTVNFKDVDIKTVLHYLSEVSGVDIVPSPGVEAQVTMRLRDKPWDVALDIVTRNYGYIYSREGDIIRVFPRSQLSAEEPVTEVIPLNNIIREIELTKSTQGDTVGVEAKEESIQQLMKAINSLLDRQKGENATFIASSNSIIVSAIPTRISMVQDLIAKIDKKTPQIMLDAKVIEIQLDDDERFGVDWNAVISASGARRPTTFPFTNSGVIKMFGDGQKQYYPTDTVGTSSSNFPFIDNSTGIDPLNPSIGDSPLFSYGTLDFSTFSATLSLLENRGDTEILSSPRITTLNNQKATIKVIDKIMLQKTQETTQTLNPSIVTVEFESEDEAREVGVLLTVIPHVNESGDISVNLLPEVSTNSGFSELTLANSSVTTLSLTFSSREANTVVRVRDGETIFIGGLIRKNVTKQDNRFPILGDLLGGVPLIGSAFKYESEVTMRSEIVFFVTVHLLDEGKASMDLSGTSNLYDRYKDDFVNASSRGDAETVQSGTLVEKSEEAEVKVVNVQATSPKKKKRPFLDFRKEK
ncbi:MAG: hypothetical protein PHH49_05430 [Candidatus Omnitrophica bacterium]|nr:hypothetical protein [Candidatus Omnitrophota bacterium]MDD5488384.1 hypothetical protein [Candidatus Omnitrophota bacterium]